MFIAAIIAIVLTMALAICRALAGPSVYDRLLAANMFGTKTVLFLAVVCFIYGRTDFLDMALTYALINFISTLAVLHFFQNRILLREEELRAESAAADPGDGPDPKPVTGKEGTS